MIGYTNETLEGCPPITAGDVVPCPMCGGEHEVKDSDPSGLLFIRCAQADLTKLVGVAGKDVRGVEPDASDSLPPGAVCDACWDLVAPERVPTRVKRPGQLKGDESFCVGCGRRTYSGIYILESAARRLRARLAEIAERS